MLSTKLEAGAAGAEVGTSEEMNRILDSAFWWEGDKELGLVLLSGCHRFTSIYCNLFDLGLAFSSLSLHLHVQPKEMGSILYHCKTEIKKKILFKVL